MRFGGLLLPNPSVFFYAVSGTAGAGGVVFRKRWRNWGNVVRMKTNDVQIEIGKEEKKKRR